MKYFEKDSKHNWVDENNVLLGYDSAHSCCEFADWFLADDIEKQPPHTDRDKELPKDLDWENWVFDSSFFVTSQPGDSLDLGGIAVFRIRKGLEVKYLHLFNCQNGYYSHGFEFQDTKFDDIVYKGKL